MIRRDQYDARGLEHSTPDHGRHVVKTRFFRATRLAGLGSSHREQLDLKAKFAFAFIAKRDTSTDDNWRTAHVCILLSP